MPSLAQHWPTLLILFVYLAMCLGIGWYFERRASQGVSHYYVAKRTIPGWVVSLAFYSTFVSTNTYIGQAGQSFSTGLTWVWVGVFWTVFCMMSWLMLGPRLRNQTAGLKSLTVPDYFDFRYKSPLSRATRILSALVILFATVWYMAGIAKGIAHMMESVLEIPYAWGAFGIIFFTAAYTVMGGMYGVLWTDAIQGAIMFVVAIVMAAIPFVYVGGVGELMTRLADVSHVTAAGTPIGDGLVTFGAMVSFTYILGIGLSVGMKQIAEPRCLVRFYSIDDAKGMRFAMIWTPIFLSVTLISIFGIGAMVHAMASEQEAVHLVKNTDEVIGFMLAKFGHPMVSAFVLVGLFAAGMSSLASVMLIVGTAMISDIWHAVKPIASERMIPWTKLAILGYSFAVFIMTLYPPAGIVELTSFSGALFTASFFPAVFGGLYLRWGTGHGAFWSMLLGLFTTVIWRFGIRFYVPGLADIHEIIPAFCLSSLAYIIISKATPNLRPDEAHLDKLFGREERLAAQAAGVRGRVPAPAGGSR